MNSERVSNWLTLAANIGVIVGIGFLVVELRQNSEIAAVEADGMVNPYQLILQDQTTPSEDSAR